MSRTGSTSEQKSPTEWRLRLGLALVVGVLLMIATSASAGWHSTGEGYVLQGERTLVPTTPTISPGANLAVPAGGSSQTLMAVADAPNGIQEFIWTPLSPDAGLLTLSGGRKEQATFTPPETVCNSLGEIHAYRVQAVENGGVSSPPTDVTIQVLPWGAPNAPFDGGSRTVALQAGGSQVLRPDMPSHECDRPGSDFPGVDTVWKLLDGGLVPPGVVLRAEDGRIIAGSSAITPALRIETHECANTVFDLTVQHFTDGGFRSTDGGVGVRGPESHVQVIVARNGSPSAEAMLELSPGLATSRAAAGSASVSMFRCPGEPGGRTLQARISLTSDGRIVREGTFAVPGPWQFELEDVCLETTFGLRGELLDGGSGSVVEGNPVTVLALERPTLQPMEAPYLTARCGQPAMGILEQRPRHPCSELPISWTQVGGIALTQPTFTGQRIEVATQSTDFAELIGQSVVMRMSATTQQEARLDQEVPILAEPFVELHRRTEKATGADTELMGVSVELRNTTECGVSQVDHQERLEGVDYVPGSMRFNGDPREPTVDGDTLTLQELALEGGTTGLLTYVVRPRLLESPHFEGQTFVHGVPVSRPLEEPSAGCGCTGAGSGLAAIGLAGLALALRRRREW